jgi:NAD(P)-dependent dehydrogenase (short-subunit alcohol dehydrogenase family)
VVALTEGLYHQMRMVDAPIGVSCLCPGWVRTGIADAERNWPSDLGAKPEVSVTSAVAKGYLDRAISEGTTPASVADLVANAVEENRYWIFPHQNFLDMAIDRWHLIESGADPIEPAETPGMPPREQMRREIRTALGLPPE